MAASFPFTLEELQSKVQEEILVASFSVCDGGAFCLVGYGTRRRLMVLAAAGGLPLERFEGEERPFLDGYNLKLCPLSNGNARALREHLPWLRPSLLGLSTTAGFGDRLGMATPGHVAAMRRVQTDVAGARILPIFAQQSIREMERTGRSPEDVLADATWGAFQAGWSGPVGADADHLKTTADIDACVEAGFSLYTFDPGAHVNSSVDAAGPAEIRLMVERLPWEKLEDTAADLERRYVGMRVQLEDRELRLDGAGILRAAAKYGKAVAHVVAMYRHLAGKGIDFEVEISVDETETPTSPVEHYYVAAELKRLGVSWVSLAPRYVGRFEKGVDYIGDPRELKEHLDAHAAIARTLGPYKLSLHSGSDKFTVYPMIAEATRGMVHLKTAGTSYLEALRVVARLDPTLFRDILAFARDRYPEDRASYHVSAQVERVPAPSKLSDEELPGLLDRFDAREVLHVTFGSTLASFGDRLKAVLRDHESEYHMCLERHFYRHLRPFAWTGGEVH